MKINECMDTLYPLAGAGWASRFPRMHRARNATLKALIAFFDRLAEWQLLARQRRELRQLTDRELKDIGLSRVDAEREAAKPFWRSSGDGIMRHR